MTKPQGQKKNTLPKDFEEIIEKKDIEKLKKVFDTCSVNARGGYGKTTALSFRNIPNTIIRWLIENGADIEAVDVYKQTALHHHCRYKNSNISILLKLGANINAIDKYGQTPLHIAAGSCNIHAIKELIAYGADSNALNEKKQTPLEYALDHANNIDIVDLVEVSTMFLEINNKITQKMKDAVTRIGENFERYRESFNKRMLKKTDEALNNLYKIYNVPPVKRRTLHDGTSPIHVDGKTWQKQFENLWDLLVPGSGPAKTLQGEVVRIAGKIRGEIFDNGGANWDNDFREITDVFLIYISSNNPLSDNNLQKAKVIIKEIRKNGDGEDTDLNFLCELATKWIRLNPNPIKLQRPSYEI